MSLQSVNKPDGHADIGEEEWQTPTDLIRRESAGVCVFAARHRNQTKVLAKDSRASLRLVQRTLSRV